MAHPGSVNGQLYAARTAPCGKAVDEKLKGCGLLDSEKNLRRPLRQKPLPDDEDSAFSRAPSLAAV
jgi:hypothetical protein